MVSMDTIFITEQIKSLISVNCVELINSKLSFFKFDKGNPGKSLFQNEMTSVFKNNSLLIAK